MKRLYVALSFVIIALGFAGYIFWQYFYLATITLDTVPSEAKVTVNGKPEASHTLHLKAGSYTVTVEAPGYRSQSLDLKVGIGSQVDKRVELVSLPRPVKVLDGPISSVRLSPDRKTIFFLRANSLYRYDLAGSAGPIAITPPLADIRQVDWSPDFQLALLYKTDGEVELYDLNRYDLLHQSFKSLGKTIKQSAWAADGSGFFYEEQSDQGEHSIIKANKAGEAPVRLQGLAGFPIAKPIFTLGTDTNLYLSSNDPKEPADIHLFNTYERLFTPLTESRAAYGPVVSPNKSTVAYIDNGELVSAEASGKNKRNLTVRAKLGTYQFTSDTNLVAITPNRVTSIDVTTGTKETFEVFAPSDTLTELFADEAGNLFYVYNGNLYRLTYK